MDFSWIFSLIRSLIVKYDNNKLSFIVCFFNLWFIDIKWENKKQNQFSLLFVKMFAILDFKKEIAIIGGSGKQRKAMSRGRNLDSEGKGGGLRTTAPSMQNSVNAETCSYLQKYISFITVGGCL